MSRLHYHHYPVALFDFQTVRLAGRKFELRRYADYEARSFLKNVGFAIRQYRYCGGPPLRLFTLRAEFRELIADAPVGGLVSFLYWHLESFSNPEPIALVLWLLGRCRAKRALPVVAMFRDYWDVSVRKEAARALERLGAWSDLRAMAEDETDPTVRRLLEEPQRRPFAERMAKFSENVAPPESPQPSGRRLRMATFWSVLPGYGKPPKSAQYIRMLLERIRALLHGSV